MWRPPGGLVALLEDVHAAGHQVLAVAVPVGTTKVPKDLRKILASHTLLHAAEAAGLPVLRFDPKGFSALDRVLSIRSCRW